MNPQQVICVYVQNAAQTFYVLYTRFALIFFPIINTGFGYTESFSKINLLHAFPFPCRYQSITQHVNTPFFFLSIIVRLQFYTVNIFVIKMVTKIAKPC